MFKSHEWEFVTLAKNMGSCPFLNLNEPGHLTFECSPSNGSNGLLRMALISSSNGSDSVPLNGSYAAPSNGSDGLLRMDFFECLSNSLLLPPSNGPPMCVLRMGLWSTLLKGSYWVS